MTNLICTNEWVVYGVGGAILVFLVATMVMQGGRRKKNYEDYLGMLETLKPGTRVKTVGGVIGTIKEMREEAPGFKTVLLETGVNGKTSFALYDLQAIYGVVDTEKLAQAQGGYIQEEKGGDDGVDEAEKVAEAKKGARKSK